MSKKQRKEKYLLGVVLLVLVLVFIYSGVQILESTVFFKEEPETTYRMTKTITRDGVEYFPRQDMTVLMVLGIDQEGKVRDSGSYNNPGLADAVMLLVFTEDDKALNVVTLNRDSMVEMPVLGVGGRPAGTVYGQLALSHTYGSGLKDSCENTKDTVSELLYGLYIDYYVSMNMDGIAIVNDAVGGVPVTVTDDFSAIDPTIKKGEMLLRGNQAVNFVRSRSGVGDELNISRMERQKEYIDSFMTVLKDKAQTDTSFILQAYSDAEEYMVTDCSSTVWASMLDKYGDYELKGVISPAGENKVGEKYMEYYLDEEALDDMILELFYAPKK